MRKEIDQFKKNGYVILDKIVLEEQINQIFNDISNVLDISLKSINFKKKLKCCDEKIKILKEKNSKLKSHCYDIFGMLDKVQIITNNKKINNFAREIYNSPLCKQSVQVRIDDPSNERNLPLHQELELMGLLGIAVWIPLVDTDQEIGGLRVVPGSHKLGLQKHLTRVETKTGYNQVLWEHDEKKIADLTVKKGQAVVFHPFLFHGSMPNKSLKTRWTLVFRFCDVKYMPYIRSQDAKMFMERNPSINSPGNDFVKNFIYDNS